ncbi:ribonuclease E/G [Phenylobacterium sp.]|jgi:Ribonuclease G/E|uniref:ribonuclease E/G n=1 Tax=Phenylobacterium sp. TaxID=1871053 RepID=UPI002F41DF85
MSERRLFLDRGIGEDRGVVTLDGRPERLLLRRDGDQESLRCGARHVARVRRVEAAIGSAFLELGEGAEAILPFRPDARPVEGEALIVEVRSEPRRGKLAVVRADGPAEGAPRLAAPPPGLVDQLRAFTRNAQIVEGREARAMADAAQAEILATVHALPGGGDLAIETTRALTSVDIDLGERKGADAKRITRQANLAAIGVVARLLRLKGLGGLVVIDLVGRGHDGTALLAAARAAFAPDNPGVAMGPVSRFGTLELTIPRRTQPLSETLCGDASGPSDLTWALALVRRLQDEARAQPGARLKALCAPPVAEAAKPLAEALALQIGARFTILPDGALAPDAPEVTRS